MFIVDFQSPSHVWLFMTPWTAAQYCSFSFLVVSFSGLFHLVMSGQCWLQKWVWKYFLLLFFGGVWGGLALILLKMFDRSWSWTFLYSEMLITYLISLFIFLICSDFQFHSDSVFPICIFPKMHIFLLYYLTCLIIIPNNLLWWFLKDISVAWVVKKTLLSEISQSQKDKHFMTPLIWGI